MNFTLTLCSMPLECVPQTFTFTFAMFVCVCAYILFHWLFLPKTFYFRIFGAKQVLWL